MTTASQQLAEFTRAFILGHFYTTSQEANLDIARDKVSTGSRVTCTAFYGSIKSKVGLAFATETASP